MRFSQGPLPLWALAVLQHVAAIAVEPSSLRANAAYDPIDVDTTTPRLTWRLSSDRRGDAQTAYQIQASTSKSFSEPSLWDTGKAESSDVYAVYDGEDLGSRSEVFWRVRVWDKRDEPSDWSDAAHFEISLLNEDDWEAEWITNSGFKTGETSLPLFAREFSVDCDISRARLYLLGLGLHIPEINGQSITDEVLQPGYMTVEDTLLYSTYDVTEHLNKGDNVLGVSLGKGIYDAEEPLLGRYRKFAQEYQELRLIAQLEYQCGSGGEWTKIVSDDSWVSTLEGPYWETSWFGGEEYDARKEIADWSSPEGDRSEWDGVSTTEGPGGKLVSPRAPPLKMFERIKPVSVEKNDDGFWVYDFGVNIAGTFVFKMDVEDEEDTRITFWPDEQSGLGQGSTGTPIFDAYTLSSASSQTYSPKFLYHGMQYVGVNTTWEPSLDDMEGIVIRAANEAVLSFETDSELFNSIHKIIDRSIQGNMHSVLTDCPHREKYGWLEQDHLVFEPLALGYDFQAYGDDLIRTIADAQAEDVPGLIPDIAPEYGRPMGGGYRNDPNWGRAVIMVPYQLYHYYGDVEILKMRHQYMVEYVDYLKRRAGGQPYLDDGGLGDWLALDTGTPKGVTSTFGYHQAVYYLAQIDEILGNDDSAQEYAQLADDIVGGFNSMWFNKTGGAHYCPENTQACQALALDMGAVSEEHHDEVLENLVTLLEEEEGIITVGEIALPSLFRVLRKAGRDDIVYRWMSSTTMPSYGYEVEHGATSLWEHWDADETGGSLNHFMYGYGDLFLLQLSGLQLRERSVGWRDINFRPVLEGGQSLSRAKTVYVTPRGAVSAEWTREGDELSYTVEVPVGSFGYVYLNGTDVREGGDELRSCRDGILGLKEVDGEMMIKVGSGVFEFEATLR